MKIQLGKLIDLAGSIQGGTAIVVGILDLYRQLRDQFGAPPDMLTDAELAQMLIDRGLQLELDNDHWLKAHGV